MQNKLKIAIASDLHLEGRHLDIHEDEGGDILLLAGDIVSIRGYSNWDTPYYTKFFQDCCKRFKHVLMVCGNHEFYRSDITTGVEQLRFFLAQQDLGDKVTVLEDSHVDIHGVRFIGSTLWTNYDNGDEIAISVGNQCLNDFRLIQNGVDNHFDYKVFHARDSVVLHNRSLKEIQRLIYDSKLPIVVMTHHSPSLKSVHEKYQHEWPLNYAFSSDLDDFILENHQIKLWVHGHTHDPFDYYIGEARIICNPRGYARENPEPYRFAYVTLDKNRNIV
jgi:predicted phosphodiesterase